MQHTHPSKQHVVRNVFLALILALLTVSSLRTLQQSATRNPNALASIEVAPAARRAALLRPALPARGYIGYMSDIPDASSYFRQYYALQYALAPLMFVSVGKLPADVPFTPGDSAAQLAQTGGLIIGNFQRPDALQAAIQSLDLDVVAQADATLVLLRRRSAAAPQQEITPP